MEIRGLIRFRGFLGKKRRMLVVERNLSLVRGEETIKESYTPRSLGPIIEKTPR